jgi:hypothetical protein
VFVIAGSISVLFIFISYAYQTVECIYNLIVDGINYSKNYDGSHSTDYLDGNLIPQIIRVILFIAFNAIIFIPCFMKPPKISLYNSFKE